MNKMNPKVDAYLNEAKKWRDELAKLRKIILDCGLSEELKWGKPCYTFQKSNLAMLYSLKDCCAVGFLKGVLLKDAKGVLIKPGEHSQSGRWMKFASLQEIARLEPVLKAYLREAMAAEKAGLKVEFKKNPEPIPEELQHKMDERPDLKTAFQALTPRRQRSHILYCSAPKQSKTRASRVESCIWKILKGKGFYDCVCGRSKRYPSCDGSHKDLR